MLTPPDGLRTDLLEAAVKENWGLAGVELDYRAVGFGSHHWEVGVAGGGRWFATLDELASRRLKRDEPADLVFARLRLSLTAADKLRAAGLDFVIAPVPTLTGELLVRLSDEFSLALYPFVEGRSYAWGEHFSAEHRRAMLDHLIAIHTAPPFTRKHVVIDDFAVQNRPELDAVLDGWRPAGCGPFEQPTLALIARHET